MAVIIPCGCGLIKLILWCFLLFSKAKSPKKKEEQMYTDEEDDGNEESKEEKEER